MVPFLPQIVSFSSHTRFGWCCADVETLSSSPVLRLRPRSVGRPAWCRSPRTWWTTALTTSPSCSQPWGWADEWHLVACRFSNPHPAGASNPPLNPYVTPSPFSPALLFFYSPGDLTFKSLLLLLHLWAYPRPCRQVTNSADLSAPLLMQYQVLSFLCFVPFWLLWNKH